MGAGAFLVAGAVDEDTIPGATEASEAATGEGPGVADFVAVVGEDPGVVEAQGAAEVSLLVAEDEDVVDGEVTEVGVTELGSTEFGLTACFRQSSK